MRQSPAAALAGITGWEQASVRELAGGLSNPTWLVEAEGRKAVLKIDDSPRGLPFNTRPEEARIQMLAAEQGIANRGLHVTDTVYMTEYLEGEVWTRRHLDDDGNLQILARALRRLHALPLTGRAFDAVGAARDYAARIDNSLAEEAREHLQTIETMPAPRELCCCHNDLVAENIISTPDVRFLDWEYACDNDPLFDLATIVVHHDLSAVKRYYLLDAYFDGNGTRHSNRLTEFEQVYRALLWLWSTARGWALPTIP